ncbi:MAG: hypothetical protein ACFE7R_04595 [Candidatus Hodarchaeota archaeon]
MKLRDKFLILVLGILILGNIGAIACTYYTTGVVNLILVTTLGLLIFVDSGVVICSRNSGGITKEISS